jgi:hypothetical protein
VLDDALARGVVRRLDGRRLRGRLHACLRLACGDGALEDRAGTADDDAQA